MVKLKKTNRKPKQQWTWRGKTFATKNELIVFLREEARKAVSGRVEEHRAVIQFHHVACNPKIQIVRGEGRASKRPIQTVKPKMDGKKNPPSLPPIEDADVNNMMSVIQRSEED